MHAEAFVHRDFQCHSSQCLPMMSIIYCKRSVPTIATIFQDHFKRQQLRKNHLAVLYAKMASQVAPLSCLNFVPLLSDSFVTVSHMLSQKELQNLLQGLRGQFQMMYLLAKYFIIFLARVLKLLVCWLMLTLWRSNRSLNFLKNNCTLSHVLIALNIPKVSSQY